MKTTLTFCLAACALVLSACGGDAPEPEVTTTTPTADMALPERAVARMENGVQVIEITAGMAGYEPGTVMLQGGVPARLIFTRTADGACSSQVKVPDYGIPATDLPMNEPVAITFTPDEGGEFTFVCGMDMQRGTIVVQS